MLICLREWKPGFFSFCRFLNMLNHLEVFYSQLAVTGSSPHISIKDCQLTWIPFLLKNRFLLSRILFPNTREIQNRQLSLENGTRVYPDHKQKCAGTTSLPTSLNQFFYRCWYATTPVLEFTNGLSNSVLKTFVHVQPIYVLKMLKRGFHSPIILAVLTTKILQRVRRQAKKQKQQTPCLFLPTASRDSCANKIKRITSAKSARVQSQIMGIFSIIKKYPGLQQQIESTSKVK